MRIMISGDLMQFEVIAEEFSIDGCDEKFAVHSSVPAEIDEHLWTATHVDTGYAIAHGDEIDAAIEKARVTWLSKTPEEIAMAKARARARTRMANDLRHATRQND